MYSIVSLISAWVRQFYLPNPFATIINPSYADIFNILVGGAILHFLSYGITSIYYRKGEAPAVGSISYLIWYIINTFIFIGVGSLTSTIELYILFICFIYIVIISLVSNISNGNRYDF